MASTRRSSGTVRTCTPRSAWARNGNSTDVKSSSAASTFHFPDDLWARVVYDLVLTARDRPADVERFVAALVPIYFGRVGGFVIENRSITTEQAEDRVERQAREFELLKPYLVERWTGKPMKKARAEVRA